MDAIDKLLFDNQVSEIIDRFPTSDNDTVCIIRVDTANNNEYDFAIKGYYDDFGLALLDLCDQYPEMKTVILSVATTLMVIEN